MTLVRTSTKVFVSVLTLFCATVLPVFAGDIEDARESLYLWQPTQVSLENGSLTIVLSERRITDTIYVAVISGICVGALNGRHLPSMNEVILLNQFSNQGYVYEAGTEDCELLGYIAGRDGMIDYRVAGKTHYFIQS